MSSIVGTEPGLFDRDQWFWVFRKQPRSNIAQIAKSDCRGAADRERIVLEGQHQK
jgi:hypothetical protein